MKEPQTDSAATPSITSSSSFSGGASGGFNKYGSNEAQYSSRGSSNFGAQRNFGGGSKHSSEMTPRLSMDASKGWGNKGSNSQIQDVKKMDGGSSGYGGSGGMSGSNRSGNSSRASSREGSISGGGGQAVNSRESSRTRTDNKSKKSY